MERLFWARAALAALAVLIAFALSACAETRIVARECLARIERCA